MRTVLLVPRREDNGPRDEIWDWCRRRWERYHSVPIYEGHHDDGPFNRSAAVNLAAKLAGDWDVGVVIDSDIFVKVSQFNEAVLSAAGTGKVTWAHRRWRGLHKEWTERIVADRFDANQDLGPELENRDMDILVERTNPISWSCCIAFPRAVWDDLGGFDERFRGWGFEDMALQSAVVGLYGHERIEGDVYHLWHPRSEERIVKGRSATTASPEYITNARLGRRYMVALRRDHGLHDRPGLPSSEEERQRDIANLIHDDEKLADQSRHLNLPDWSNWWPTLTELRDGAKEHRDGPLPPEPTITVIVQTGGQPANWPARKKYLEKSLKSLSQRVSGPIVQRVIYDCWGDVEIRRELGLIGARHGFYVVGPEPADLAKVDDELRHAWSRQQLWRYAGKRAVGEFIFGTEDDFIYDRDVDLTTLAEELRADKHLYQIALLRAPFFPRELEAGSIIAEHPDDYQLVGSNGNARLENRLYFTNNPALFRTTLPKNTVFRARRNSEALFSKELTQDPRVRFAYWGDGEPWVSHIGEVRAGSGY